MGQFEGKVALVTGGNSGLGKATAEAFAREGAKVVIAARREALGREVEASIRAAGGEARFIACDISSEEQIRKLVERTVQTYGRLDYAYNNAWAAPKLTPLTEVTTDAYDEMFTSLRGAFLCMKHEIPAMISGGGGAIVNCSSMVTKMAIPYLGPYSAAKAGLEMLTRTTAHECADKNIRVNSVCLGAFQTPMASDLASQLGPQGLDAILARIALKRYGRLDEVAHTVLFLCSEGASFIIGANLLIDGGHTLT
jgi:NAD(P)-dependent dehydrogenase (short-subunit alcohol dehydrogenase family)